MSMSLWSRLFRYSWHTHSAVSISPAPMLCLTCGLCCLFTPTHRDEEDQDGLCVQTAQAQCVTCGTISADCGRRSHCGAGMGKTWMTLDDFCFILWQEMCSIKNLTLSLRLFVYLDIFWLLIGSILKFLSEYFRFITNSCCCSHKGCPVFTAEL